MHSRSKASASRAAGGLGLAVLLALGACASDSTSPPEADPCDLSAVVADAGSPGVIYTWAGSGRAGFDGDGNPLLESRFSQPNDLLFHSSGTAYILDWNNHSIREVTAEGALRTVVGTSGFPGDGPDDQHPDLDDRVAPVDGRLVLLNHPTELTELTNGNLLLAAWHNHKLREYVPGSGEVFVSCGDVPGFQGDGASHQGAKLRQPPQAELGDDGHVYILDQVNLRIRRIRDYMTDPDGIIETVAGNGNRGFAGDGGDPLQAEFSFDDDGGNPDISGGMVYGPDGHLYIADSLNHRIRRIDFTANRIDTVAGTGTADWVDGPADQACFNRPLDLEFGPDGRLYVADEHNHAIRAIDLEAETVTTVAGRGQTLDEAGDPECFVPTSTQIGDGGPATDAFLDQPRGIAFDADGRLYIADTFHYRIRVMTLQGDL